MGECSSLHSTGETSQHEGESETKFELAFHSQHLASTQLRTIYSLATRLSHICVKKSKVASRKEKEGSVSPLPSLACSPVLPIEEKETHLLFSNSSHQAISSNAVKRSFRMKKNNLLSVSFLPQAPLSESTHSLSSSIAITIVISQII